MRDGVVDQGASRIGSLSAGVYIGPISQALEDAAPAQLVRLSAAASLQSLGIGARD